MCKCQPDLLDLVIDMKDNIPHNSPPYKWRRIIKELLAESNLSVSEFARRISLPQPTIHRLLTGITDDPKLSTLSVIANYFSISLDQLLGHTPLSSDPTNNRSEAHFIPLISWQDAIRYEKAAIPNEVIHKSIKILVDDRASTNSFCLKTKKSMEPRFSNGTLLIVDPNIQPTDGDLVLANYPNTTEATIRELISDGPKKALLSILNGSLTDDLTDNIKLIGVIVEARINYK